MNTDSERRHDLFKYYVNDDGSVS